MLTLITAGKWYALIKISIFLCLQMLKCVLVQPPLLFMANTCNINMMYCRNVDEIHMKRTNSKCIWFCGNTQLPILVTGLNDYNEKAEQQQECVNRLQSDKRVLHVVTASVFIHSFVAAPLLKIEKEIRIPNKFLVPAVGPAATEASSMCLISAPCQTEFIFPPAVKSASVNSQHIYCTHVLRDFDFFHLESVTKSEQIAHVSSWQRFTLSFIHSLSAGNLKQAWMLFPESFRWSIHFFQLTNKTLH